jgi:hypothetical protein
MAPKFYAGGRALASAAFNGRRTAFYAKRKSMAFDRRGRVGLRISVGRETVLATIPADSRTAAGRR